MIDVNLILTKAIDWAKEAGRKSLEEAKKGLEVSFKSSPSDLVTRVDKETEEFLIGQILTSFPDHGIIGEEGTFERDPSEFETLWIIDPIDGTTNFVHQQLNYVVSVAVTHKGEGMIGVIYDPSRDELFHAVKGQGAFLNGEKLEMDRPVKLRDALICTSLFWSNRLEEYGLEHVTYDLPKRCRGVRVYGCAALEMAYVAAGRIDAYISMHLNPWDFAAGNIILEQAGGTVSAIDGSPLPYDQASTVIAANKFLYQELTDYIKD